MEFEKKCPQFAIPQYISHCVRLSVRIKTALCGQTDRGSLCTSSICLQFSLYVWSDEFWIHGLLFLYLICYCFFSISLEAGARRLRVGRGKWRIYEFELYLFKWSTHPSNTRFVKYSKLLLEEIFQYLLCGKK